jgi:hypothetical protein
MTCVSGTQSRVKMQRGGRRKAGPKDLRFFMFLHLHKTNLEVATEHKLKVRRAEKILNLLNVS